jgi:uncharacterized repeat protein (TIGR01451 family)
MKRGFLWTKLLLLSATIGVTYAQTIAYDVPLQPGNQPFTGNLGLDFDVLSPIVVTQLGAFDNNGDGFVGAVSVQIFNRDTAAGVGPVVVFANLAGTLTNGSRFLPIAPLLLAPGHYSIVAIGFNATDLTGNSTAGGTFVPSTENTGGGLIVFVGTGRFNGHVTLDFPTIVPAGTPSNVFLAGTFSFSPAAPPTISKAFGQPIIAPGGITTLSFTISNPSPIVASTGIAFSDTLPSGLVVATPNGLIGSCGGGIITATAGSNNISLFGATLAAGASCTFSVNVLAGAAGMYTNVTSAVTSNTGTGNAASASINVTGSSAPGKLSAPTGVLFTPLGTIMVVDQGNNRVQVFDTNFNFKFQFGNTPGPGQLKQPTGIALGPLTVFVTDTGNNRVVVFDLSGNFKTSFGQ